MATTSNSVENLLDAVKQLSAAERAQFTARLVDWQESEGESESFLVQQTKLRLPIAEAARLKELAAKSEQHELTPLEREEYRRLAQSAECINAARLQALAELARRRNQPVSRIKKDVVWREEQHGA